VPLLAFDVVAQVVADAFQLERLVDPRDRRLFHHCGGVGLRDGRLGEPGEPKRRLALLSEGLSREAALHLGEERVHALDTGRAAADGGAKTGRPGVATGHREHRRRFAPRVVERIEVEPAVAAEHIVGLDKAAGVTGPQAEDHLGRGLIDCLDLDYLVGNGGFALGAFRHLIHAVTELQVRLCLKEDELLGRLLRQKDVEFDLLAGGPRLELDHAVGLDGRHHTRLLGEIRQEGRQLIRFHVLDRHRPLL
jgi:hypothetical protein